MRLEYKLGDTKPDLTVQLVAEEGFSLVGSTLVFKLRKPSGTVVNKSVTVEDLSTLQLKIEWVLSDLNELGTYRGEIIVTNAGAERTFPNNRYITIIVNPDA